jgi:iron complex transport system permease protein
MSIATRIEGRSVWRPGNLLLYLAAALCLALAVTLSLALGPTGISLGSLPRAVGALLSTTDDPAVLRDRLVLIDVRLPRTLIGLFVGASLALAGAMMQGMFRNPLADPTLIGVSSGAALAAITVIALGNSLAAGWIRLFGAYALPFAAFGGGFAVTSILMLITSRKGRISTATLLLAGIALAAMADAVRGLISFASDDRELRDVTLWLFGSLAGASWSKVLGVVPFAVLLAVALPRLVRTLNGLLLGEAEAYHLGISVQKSKLGIVIVTAAAVGAAVAVAGVVGFVGIIIPHLVRLVAGPDHRNLLPVSAMLGATLVLLADVIARLIVHPAELPIGIVTAAIGAPVFLHLVLNRGAGGGE